MDEALEREKRYLEQLFSHVPMSVIVFEGHDHVITMVNDSFDPERDRQEFIGKNVKEAYPEASAKGLLATLDMVYQTGQSFSAQEILDPTKESYWNISWKPWRPEGTEIKGVIGVGSEITEQVLARRRVAELAAENHRKTVEALEQNARTLNAGLELQDILHAIVNRLSTLVSCDLFSIILIDSDGQPDRHLMWRTDHSSFVSLNIKSFEITNNGVMQKVLAEKKPLVFLEPHKYPGWMQGEASRRFGTLLSIPVIQDGRILAVLNGYRYAIEDFEEQDIRLASIFSETVATALTNAELYRRVQKQAETRAALAEASKQINGSLDLDKMLKTLLGRAKQLMQADIVRVRLVKGKNANLVVSSELLAEETLQRLEDVFGRVLLGYGIAGKVWHTKQPQWSSNYQEDTSFEHDEMMEILTNAGSVKASLIIPVMEIDELAGLIWFNKKEVYEWQPEDIELGKEIASIASVAIHNANLYEQLRQQTIQTSQRNQELEALQLFSQKLKEDFELDTTLEHASLLVLEMSKAYGVGIHLRQENKKELELAVCLLARNPAAVTIDYQETAKVFEAYQNSKITPLNPQMILKVAEDNQPLLIEDTLTFPVPVFSGQTDASYSLISTPLQVEGENIGVLTIIWQETNVFKSEQVRFVTIVAEQIAAAISRVRLLKARENEARLEAALSLARTVAHQLNQQLTILQAELDMIVQYGQPMDDNAKDSLQSAISTMANQIRQYQALSRLVIDQAMPGFNLLDMTQSTSQP